MKRSLCVAGLVLLAACASPTIEEAPASRSDITMDSGRPMSDRLKLYTVDHYDIHTNLLTDEKAIEGLSTITFRARNTMTELELDFDGQFAIESVRGTSGVPGPAVELDYRQSAEKLTVTLAAPVAAGDSSQVTVKYHGVPHEAIRPPWKGGFTWRKTPSGKPWIATSFQGEGCDIWFPCKDHPDGEPQGLDLHLTVDAGLTAVANGVLIDVTEHDNGRQTFHWRTRVPTNTYGIALNVAPYVLIEDRYTSTNGTEVPVMFWALEDRQGQAEALFHREFIAVAKWFEAKVGPYPWGQEKLGIVETPHLGMEHQTVNAYGNRYRLDDYGFDWLFHHEIAHEWFGNVMTHTTVSDMWLHEGFGGYMQPIYTLDLMGEAAFNARMYQSYLQINACNPIAPREELSADQLYFDDVGGVGPGADIYTKGAWVLQSLRYVMGDEAFWRAVRILVFDTPNPEQLKPPIQARFRSTDDFLRIASEVHGSDLSWFFEVYARQGPLPELETVPMNLGTELRWHNSGDSDFPMPVPVRVNGENVRVEFSGNRALIPSVRPSDIAIDPQMQILRKLPVVETCAERRSDDEI